MKLDFLKGPQREFLSEGNYHKGQTVEERFQDIVDRVRDYESLGFPAGLSNRIKHLLEENIFSLSTPTLANFGKKESDGSLCKNLPASCNIVSVENSVYGIYYANLEVAMLSKRGAGVGIDFTLLPDGGTLIDNTFYSNSKIDWIKSLIDTSQKVSQGGVRRGYATPFESIESETFEQLLKEVDKNNPDKTSVLLDNTIGCVIPEGFMSKIESGDKVAQRKFLNLLNERKKSGQIYISYVENMNKNCSEVYKKLGYIISNSNICVEFCQPYMQGYTPVCVIGAINLMKWDKVKEDPQIIKDIIYFLNIMNEEYVLLTKDQPGLERAHAAARDKKDIGLGTLGLHSLFQSKGMAFGSVESRLLNKEIYSTIQKYSIEASEELADLLGPCKFAKEVGMNRRNCSLNMIAPNKSTSFLNTIDDKGNPCSLGIEPYFSNIFTKRLAKIQYTFKNPFLEKLLEEKGQNTFKVWEDISNNLGSVQHLDFLTKEEKDVFLTFGEISPKDIIDLAADRQVYIDMGQSLNLMNRPNYTNKDLFQIHKYAFDKGIKTLYYFYPQAHASLEKEGKSWDSCISCAD